MKGYFPLLIRDTYNNRVYAVDNVHMLPHGFKVLETNWIGWI